MRKETCDDCGTVLSGNDVASLTAVAQAHFDSAHAEWGLSKTSVSNWLDAKKRITGSTERLQVIGKIDVYAVTAERIDDVLAFFDHDGFADNPGWASCYCVFYNQDDLQTAGGRPWEQNRAELEARLRTGSTVGYLAYVDGKLAGWCNASPRTAYPVRRTGQDDGVGVVACFVIAPPYRRHGLARRLLDSAIEGFAERGIRRVEAHPVIGTESDAPNYHGPLSLYMDAGFTEVERNERTALVVKELH